MVGLAGEAEDRAEIRVDYARHQVIGGAEGYLSLEDIEGIGIAATTLEWKIELKAKRLKVQVRSSPIDAIGITPKEIIIVSDGWAWSRGTYRVNVGRSNTTEAFLTIFERQEKDSWQIYRNAWHKALAAEPPS